MNCSSRCSPVSDVHIRLRAPARSRDGGAAGLWTEEVRDPPAELKVWVDDYYDRGLIEMPVFKRATSITLFIDRFDISLPPAGNFDKLEHLVLRGYCSVNHSVFLSRCPRLRELEIISPVQNKVTMHLAFSCIFCKSANPCMHILYTSSPLTL